MSAKLYAVKFQMPELPAISAKEFEDRVVTTLSALAFDFIVRKAQDNLGSTRGDYIRGVQPPKRTAKGAIIILRGALPNMVENGWAGGDLRKTLIDKNKKKRRAKPRKGKDGKMVPGHYYAYIPFTHKSKGLPRNVLAAAKELTATLTAPGAGATRWGSSLPKGLAKKRKEHHATDPFAGMYRLEKTYRAATQNTYRTFRTISQASKRGWHHPGIKARHFFKEAAAHLEKVKDDVVRSVASEMGL